MQNISLFDIWGFSSQALKAGNPWLGFLLPDGGEIWKSSCAFFLGSVGSQTSEREQIPCLDSPARLLHFIGWDITPTPPTNPSLRIFKGDIFALKLLIPFRFYAGEAVRKFPKVCSMLCGVARQEIQTLRRAQNLSREGCRKKTEKVWSFTKNIKVVRVFCLFLSHLGHFWRFLRPQNRGLAFYYPPRPPRFDKRPNLFRVFSALFPKNPNETWNIVKIVKYVKATYIYILDQWKCDK